MSEKRLRLALIGAGSFVRKAHAPALAAMQDRVQVVAVCSRSHKSAATVAEMLPEPVEIYDHIPSLLAVETLDAVDVVLPIPMLPDVVQMALEAGKHVVSEKPIAPTSGRARELIALHQQRPNQVWMVAENYRYEQAYRAAAQAIADGAIGKPLVFDWSLQLPVDPDSPYYRTEWRRTNQYPGGFVLDGGVHHVAGLRTVLGEIVDAGGIHAAHREDLPPMDTLAAWIRCASGAVGTYTVTYAAGSPLSDNALHVVGDQGSLRVNGGRLVVHNNEGTQEQTFGRPFSVELELAAFVDAVQEGRPHRNTPEEAFRDLLVVEALLGDGVTG